MALSYSDRGLGFQLKEKKNKMKLDKGVQGKSIWVIWLWDDSDFIKYAFTSRKKALDLIRAEEIKPEDYYLTQLKIV